VKIVLFYLCNEQNNPYLQIKKTNIHVELFSKPAGLLKKEREEEVEEKGKERH
jgi:hypothetical protein